jgi:hypothetical protein
MIEIRDINIQNSEFLDILNEYKDTLMAKDKDDVRLIEKEWFISFDDQNPEKWISDAKMHDIIKMGERHDGYPECLRGFSGLRHDHPSPGGDIIKDASRTLNTKMIGFLSARNSALNACYPPGGFISWHNNANAHGYNIICTWSETGEGWFDYWDVDKKERVRIEDKPGWQAKMTYFGPYEEPDKLCYHAAYTDCYRITVAFVFAEADEFWQEVIEDLETPV